MHFSPWVHKRLNLGREKNWSGNSQNLIVYNGQIQVKISLFYQHQKFHFFVNAFQNFDGMEFLRFKLWIGQYLNKLKHSDWKSPKSLMSILKKCRCEFYKKWIFKPKRPLWIFRLFYIIFKHCDGKKQSFDVLNIPFKLMDFLCVVWYMQQSHCLPTFHNLIPSKNGARSRIILPSLQMPNICHLPS